MNKEEELHYYLRVIATHFIKHCIPLPEQVARVTGIMEKGQWKALSAADKQGCLKPLSDELLNDDSELNKHFREYPHHWSRDKFNEFKVFVSTYAGGAG